ncbi:TIGR04282 family arsenosugar biosynthesis glycosyltransferase [Desulfobacula toluolica]|uniref:Conserved uncharacterized protein n=1 Tax=Desulfobacula toluolica (strain DSM 7467 / Tol2) TaxID=651182 RepID=K0NN51_DESTT|nr:TIGR04282 family arsenosugar biosynthesis glycosyltransferase [Desulfobacula toluolica]CCK81433.1 conserved uncharacterized protein [Desulfobacula toluolica Tol2]
MISKAIIVFLRAPEEGRVKTRLSRGLSNAFVLELYKAFVCDTLEALALTGDKHLYFWPRGKEKILQKWLGTQYQYSLQQGEDIGQRMANAFVDIFKKGYDSALLVGTDIPELSTNLICLAYDALQTKDAVIGPSSDGGYYLIGFEKSAFLKNMFDGIDWSTSAVMDQTIKIMNRMSIRYKLLEEMNDIDTPADFNALIERVKKGGKAGKRTHRILDAYEDGYINYHTCVK